MTHPHRFVSALVALAVSLALVVASGTVQRVGGQAVYNQECRLGLGDAACLEDQEVAGLPIPFLIDSPVTSVVHQVALFEDQFVAWAFVLDVVLVWALLFGLWVLARRQMPVAALVAVLALAGCRSAPLIVEEAKGGVIVESYVPDPDTGRLVRGELEQGDVTVAFDAVTVEEGLLTITGRAEIEGRGGYGAALLVEGYARTGIPEGVPLPEREGPYPWAGRPLADGALAYMAQVYRNGRFTLRAPLVEAEADTLLVAYGNSPDWVRVPVADLLAGRRFWASSPGAVPNPEARPVDGLRLRPVDRRVVPGDSVRFVLSYRPLPPQRELGSLILDSVPAESSTASSPSFGVSCMWRVERWDDGWQAVPLAWWRDTDDVLYGCTAQGIRFTAATERREGLRLRTTAAPGRYRWCLDAHTEQDGRSITRPLCSTAFLVDS